MVNKKGNRNLYKLGKLTKKATKEVEQVINTTTAIVLQLEKEKLTGTRSMRTAITKLFDVKERLRIL